jgi:flagellar hook capping protein FlgD
VQGLTAVNEVRVEWPDGTADVFNNVNTNRTLVVDQAGIVAVDPPAGGTLGAGAVSLVEVSPNPFAGAAAFRFTIPASSPVRLEIFDASGRAVRTLVDEVQRPGAHEARWDGRDSNQEPVAAGVYLYRLDAAGRSARGKVSVVR